MLDHEKKLRVDLKDRFEVKMKGIQDEITTKKDERSKGYEENDVIRTKIQKVIAEYQEKEADYK
jgi:hypothetical protein